MSLDLLKRLTEAHGIPGREEAIREIVIDELKPITNELHVDAMGNVISHKEGQGGPKVMIAAHMDEIGFLISHVDEKTGFLRLENLGGFDPRVLLAKRVVIHTDSGQFIGAIGTKPAHILTEEERKKAYAVKDLFVDIGLPADQVVAKVRVGDFVTLRQDFVEMGDLISCKALDDRVGVYVMIEAIRRVNNPTAEIYAVATTQEEVGLRGARVSGYEVSPDIGIALDVTLACDVPGTQDQDHITKLGKGTAIKIKDSSSISHPRLFRAFRDLAEKKNIPHQFEILPRGGTDAGAMQMNKEGVAAITISIPTRYIHSVVESAHKDDIEASIALLAAFLEIAHEVDLSL
jgi:endoglucanase